MSEKLRYIGIEEITDAVAELCIKANTEIRDDILRALESARDRETAALSKAAFDAILKNSDIAAQDKLPLCQDTGMAVVFVSIGSNVHISGDVDEAINEGVRRGYRDGYCRSSVVRDPVRRDNTGDNTPAIIHYDFHKGENLRITVAPKGFGSENMGAIRMMNPSDGLEGAEDYIVEAVKTARASPCPPIIVGVGMGGTMEKAALLAKQALLRDVGSINADPFWAGAEARLLERINALGIGPAGFGGVTTALGVHIETYPTHIAGLPVAVSIGCHATRHKTAVL